MEPLTQTPPSKLRAAYDYLKAQDVTVPADYTEFESGMQDPARLEKLYGYFKQQDVTVPDSYDEFASAMLGDVKKKPTLPETGPVGSSTSGVGALPSEPDQEFQSVPDLVAVPSPIEPDAAVAPGLQEAIPFAPGSPAAPLAANLPNLRTGQPGDLRAPATEESNYLSQLPAFAGGPTVEDGKERVAIPNDYTGAVPPGAYQLKLGGEGDRTQYFDRDLSKLVDGQEQSVWDAATKNFGNQLLNMGKGGADYLAAADRRLRDSPLGRAADNVGGMLGLNADPARGVPFQEAAEGLESLKGKIAPFHEKSQFRVANPATWPMATSNAAALAAPMVLSALLPESKIAGVAQKLLAVGFDGQILEGSVERAKAAGLTGAQADNFVLADGAASMLVFKLGGAGLNAAGQKLLQSEMGQGIAAALKDRVAPLTQAELNDVLTTSAARLAPILRQAGVGAASGGVLFGANEAKNIAAERITNTAVGREAFPNQSLKEMVGRVAGAAGEGALITGLQGAATAIGTPVAEPATTAREQELQRSPVEQEAPASQLFEQATPAPAEATPAEATPATVDIRGTNGLLAELDATGQVSRLIGPDGKAYTPEALYKANPGLEAVVARSLPAVAPPEPVAEPSLVDVTGQAEPLPSPGPVAPTPASPALVEPSPAELPLTPPKLARAEPAAESLVKLSESQQAVNAALDALDNYNKLTSRQTRGSTGSKARAEIAELGRKAGLTVGVRRDYSLSVTREGKRATRFNEYTSTTPAANHVPLAARPESARPFLEDVVAAAEANPAVVQGLGINVRDKALSARELAGAIADIKAGKNTLRAQLLLDTLEEAHAQGYVVKSEGTGMMTRRFQVPLDEFVGKKPATEHEEVPLADAELDQLRADDPNVRQAVEDYTFSDGSIDYVRLANDEAGLPFLFDVTEESATKLATLARERAQQPAPAPIPSAEEAGVDGRSTPQGAASPDGTSPAGRQEVASSRLDAIRQERTVAVAEIKRLAKTPNRGRVMGSFVPIDPEMAQAVATVLKTYVQEGLVRTADLVSRFRAEVGNEQDTGLSDEQLRYVAKRVRPEAAAEPVSVEDGKAAIREVLSIVAEKGTNRTANLGAVTPEVAGILAPHMLRDAQATIHTVDAYAVRHILNSHGDPAAEAARGQLPVTPADIERIPEILAQPDKVTYKGENSRGQPLIGYEKTIGDTLYYVEEYRAKGNALHTETLYKRAQKGKGGETDAEASVSPNVLNDPPAASNVRPSEPTSLSPDEPEGTAQRASMKRVLADESQPPALREKIRDTGLDKYEPKSVAETEKAVAAYMARNSLTDAYAEAISTTDNLTGDVRTALRARVLKVVGEMLSAALEKGDTASADTYLEQSYKVAEALAKRGTDAGREINAYKLLATTAPEAVVYQAQKEVAAQRQKEGAKLGKKLKGEVKAVRKAKAVALDEALTTPAVRAVREKVAGKQKATTKERIADIKAERASLFEQLRALSKSKPTVAYSTVVPLTPEMAKAAALHVKIFRTYLQEGILRVGTLVERLRKDAGPAIGNFSEGQLRQQAAAAVGDHNEAIRQGTEALGTTLEKIARDHLSDPAAIGKTLAEQFVSEAGLEPADAKAYAAAIEAEFSKRIDTARSRRLAQLDKRAAATPAKRPVASDLEKTRELFTLSPTDDAAILDHLKRVNDLPELTTQDVADLRKLAQAVQAAPEGFQRDEAVEKLLKRQADVKGVNWAEIGQAMWYANVLSGYKTHVINFTANVIQTGAELGINTTHAVLTGKGRYATASGKGLLAGLGRGIREAHSVLATGRETSREPGKYEVPGLLENLRSNNPARALKYINRFLRAGDMLFSSGLKEMRAYEQAVKLSLEDATSDGTPNQDIWARASEKLYNTKQRLADARQQATDEGLKGNDLERRIYEIAEQSRGADIMDEARVYAPRAVFNGEVEGGLGWVATGIQKITEGINIRGFKPAKYIVPFTRVITNVANASLDYTPVGAGRAALGHTILGGNAESRLQRQFTTEERQKLAIKSVIGASVAVASYALSNNKDENGKPTIELTGLGTGNPSKDAQLRADGWQPYSIKVGDTWYSYANFPVAIMLAGVGSYNDAHKYGGKEPDDQGTLETLYLHSFRALQFTKDMTALKGAADFLSAVDSRNPTDITKWAQRLAAGSIKGYVPFSSLLTQIAKDAEQVAGEPKKQGRSFGQMLYQDIPVARDGINNALDALGDPLPVDTDRLFSAPPHRDQSTQRVWNWLNKNNLFISVPNRNSGGALVLRAHEGKEGPMTDEEYYKFMQNRGGEIKTLLLANMEKLEKLDPKAAKEVLSEIAEGASERAKVKTFFPSAGSR